LARWHDEDSVRPRRVCAQKATGRRCGRVREHSLGTYDVQEKKDTSPTNWHNVYGAKPLNQSQFDDTTGESSAKKGN
jgi:hypothetical protein